MTYSQFENLEFEHSEFKDSNLRIQNLKILNLKRGRVIVRHGEGLVDLKYLKWFKVDETVFQQYNSIMPFR